MYYERTLIKKTMAITRAKMIRYTVFGLLGVIVVVTLLTTIFSGFSNVQSQWDGIKLVIGRVNWWWVLAAAMTNLGTFFFEAFQLWFLAKTLGKKTSFWRMWEIYFVGNFFSNALPSTSGGEAFQVYFLQDDGLKVAESSVIITVRGIISVGVRLLFIFAILLAIPFGFQLPTGVALTWITYVSLAMFALMVAFGVLVIVNPFIFVWLVNLLSKWKWLLRVSKINDVEEFKKKGLSFLAEVRHAGRIMFSGNKFALFMAILNSVVTWFLLKTMPYFVLLALGESPNLLAVMAIGVIAQLATAWFPTPGAVGALELGISTFFMSFITVYHTKPEIAAAVGIFTLIYRFMDYHMDVLFGAPVALTMLTKKLGKDAATADLAALSTQVSKQIENEQMLDANEDSTIASLEADKSLENK